jgi:hypothetical protein
MRSPFLTALVHPLNIAMLGLSVVAGLVAAWWLFPLGLLFWLAMVIRVSRDAALQFSYRMQSREPLAQRYQEYFDRIERSQLSVFNNLAAAPAGMRRVLQPIQKEIDALTTQVYSLCQRMTTLENYRVVTESGRDLEADLARVDAAMQRTNDAIIRQEYEASRQSIQERLNKLRSVSVLLDRVEAQLMGLANELDGVMTEVIRLQAMAPEDAAQHVPTLQQSLQEQSEQIRAFEREAIQV